MSRLETWISNPGATAERNRFRGWGPRRRTAYLNRYAGHLARKVNDGKVEQFRLLHAINDKLTEMETNG